MTDYVALLDSYALYIVLIIIAFTLFGLLRGAVATGASTYGVVALAVIFAVLGVFLYLTGWQLYGALLFLLGVLIVVLDGWSDRRANRKARARLRG